MSKNIQSNKDAKESQDKKKELANLLRVLSKTSNYGSEEHTFLEQKSEEMLNKFGGIDAMFKELEKIQKISCSKR